VSDCPKKLAYQRERYRLSNKQQSNKKRYRTENKQKQREWMLMSRYGITPAEYDALLEKQDNRCAICNTASCDTGKRFSVDHIHDLRMRGGEMVDVNIGNADAVRGLLCSRCNTSIGKFDDSPELLRKAAHYIEGNEIQ